MGSVEEPYSLPEIERLLWASSDYLERDWSPAFWRTSIYEEAEQRSNAGWRRCATTFPFSVERLWWSLAAHEDSSEFHRLFRHFLTEVFPRCSALPFSEPHVSIALYTSVLGTARRYPDLADILFELLGVFRSATRDYADREHDFVNTELYLRHELTRQVWTMVHNTWSPVDDGDGTYSAAIEAISFPGQNRLLDELAEKMDEELRRNGSYHPGNRPYTDIFTDKPHGSVEGRPESIEKIRSLPGLAGSDGTIPLGSAEFRALFEPEWVRRTYRRIESIQTLMIHEQMLYAYEVLDGNAVDALELLEVLLSFKGKKPPDEAWKERFAEVSLRLLGDSEKPFNLCRDMWCLPLDTKDRGKYHMESEDLSDLLTRASIWGVLPLYEMQTGSGDAPSTCDSRTVSDALVRAAERWIRVPHSGITAALAAVRVLEAIGTVEALNGLVRLSRQVKNKTALATVNKCLENLAGAWGRDLQVIEDLLVEDFDLTPSYTPKRSPAFSREWTISDSHLVTLTLDGSGRADLLYEDVRKSESVKSVPKSVLGEKDSPGHRTLAEAKATLKGIRSTLSTQTARLEEAMISGRSWSLDEWSSAIASSPLLANLYARLLWKATYLSSDGKLESVLVRPFCDTTTGGSPAPRTEGGRFADGFWRNSSGSAITLPEDSYLSVIHPVFTDGGEIVAWQTRFGNEDIAQPFKQLSREVFRPTPDYEPQGDWAVSHRFAGVTVEARRLYAILKGRGWSGMGFFGEGETPATRRFKEHGCEAVLDRIGYDVDANSEGREVLQLGLLSFISLVRSGGRLTGGERMRSFEPDVVDARAFSEAVRDVVLVASAVVE